MPYVYLGQDLWDTADLAKKYFSKHYGATGFKSESAIASDLPLRPTWQAKTRSGYELSVEVRASPFSQTLYEFVAVCAQASRPIKLWVAVPAGTPPGFADELRKAREAGIGVVQLSSSSTHEFSRASPLSLFGLKKLPLSAAPKCRRDFLKNAEATFLDGSPGAGCQELCQELEKITRQFAELTHANGQWKSPTKLKFATDAWAKVLRELEANLNEGAIKAKVSGFSMQRVVEARGHTDWRNAVSHAPKSLAALKERDARLRTMFEATRDLLVEWWKIGRPLGLFK